MEPLRPAVRPATSQGQSRTGPLWAAKVTRAGRPYRSRRLWGRCIEVARVRFGVALSCSRGWSMTEAEWAGSTDQSRMLTFLDGKASARKMRLFVCACARLLWDRLKADAMREAVEAGERQADGLP